MNITHTMANDTINVQYSQAEPGGRLRLRRWVGLHEENVMTTEMLENLRAIYLQPLRDPAQGLKPGRMSQLSKLIQNMTDKEQREELVETLKAIDKDLQGKHPISSTNEAISTRHETMLGKELAQLLHLDLTSSDFNRFAARVGLAVGGMEVEQNGLARPRCKARSTEPWHVAPLSLWPPATVA